ncbi:MAG: type II toxin-antitoxin system VapC family toxin [Actinomycetota bacterium]|nr:type II toxin-antitoxin system VapC family toxin [Actinomycetota bacterium]
MIAYIETSAFLKLVISEADSDQLRARFRTLRSGGDDVVSCRLLVTESHRAAHRVAALDHLSVTKALGQVELIDVDAELFTEAAMMPGANLRSLDALHVASALSVGSDVVLAYDTRVLEAASAVGLAWETPR